MPDLTPIRVRGKRKGLPAEKWNHGRQHKGRKVEPAISEPTSSSRASPAAATTLKKKRTAKARQLSRLEELPTEVIQFIFELAENLDLPSVSPQLAIPLQSVHLQHQLTARVLPRVLEQRTKQWITKTPRPFDSGSSCKPNELTAATRLMNCKFFTYHFFKDWLMKQFDRQSYEGLRHGDEPGHHPQLTWYDLRPSHDLLPPTKLLFAPFTENNMLFLELLTSHVNRHTVAGKHPSFSETAFPGLQQAVTHKALRALKAFWQLGLVPDMTLLRQAVIDNDCDRGVVYSIIDRAYIYCSPINSPGSESDIEYLDPELWSWAEHAQARGDRRGQWLKEILRTCAQTKDIDIDSSHMTDEIYMFRRYLMEKPEKFINLEAYGKECRARDQEADPHYTE